MNTAVNVNTGGQRALAAGMFIRCLLHPLFLALLGARVWRWSGWSAR